MIVLIYVIIILAIFLVSLYFSEREQLRLPPDLKKETKESPWLRDDLAIKPLVFTLPFFYLNKLILNRLGRKSLHNKLSAAEIRLLPEDLLGIKELIILLLILAVFASAKQLEPVWIVGAVGLGFLLPDFYLQIRIQKHKAAIIKTLPDVIDLLSLCVGAGLDFMQGMKWVVQRSRPNPLIRDLSTVIHEINIGKSRRDALKAMSERMNIQEVSSFVNTLVHAERMGTPIFEVLNILSEEVRRRRFQRGERLALLAPIKMLFPLIFFILPVVGIIVAGPIILQFSQGGLPKF